MPNAHQEVHQGAYQQQCNTLVGLNVVHFPGRNVQFCRAWVETGPWAGDGKDADVEAVSSEPRPHRRRRALYPDSCYRSMLALAGGDGVEARREASGVAHVCRYQISSGDVPLVDFGTTQRLYLPTSRDIRTRTIVQKVVWSTSKRCVVSFAKAVRVVSVDMTRRPVGRIGDFVSSRASTTDR